jgi:anti-sigma regulatory factor (Ser/Thr protein kinase)
VRGRQRDLEVVFLNLLDNAVKYGGSEPRVVVDGRLLRRGVVVIRISDNGEGVEYDLRRKIFQRFYRGGSELERTTKGTGLGLHIVKSLLARMRGSVSVSGRGPLPGATFVVELPGTLTPLLPAGAGAEDGRGVGGAVAGEPGATAGPGRVDDGVAEAGLRPAEVVPATGRPE